MKHSQFRQSRLRANSIWIRKRLMSTAERWHWAMQSVSPDREFLRRCFMSCSGAMRIAELRRCVSAVATPWHWQLSAKRKLMTAKEHNQTLGPLYFVYGAVHGLTLLGILG